MSLWDSLMGRPTNRELLETLTATAARIERSVSRLAETAAHILNHSHSTEELIVTNQETIDGYASAFADVLSNIAGDVQGLKDAIAAGATPESLDFSSLDASLASGQSLADSTPDVPPTDPEPTDPPVEG